TPLIVGDRERSTRPTRMPHGSCKFHVLAQAPAADGRLWRPRSFHALVQDKPGRKPLAEIKLMKGEPAPVERRAEDIKARHTKYSTQRYDHAAAARVAGAASQRSRSARARVESARLRASPRSLPLMRRPRSSWEGASRGGNRPKLTFMGWKEWRAS